MSYSPHLRTGLLLSGSGTAGAYHAGVLRALHEAGIKIDVVAARGVGAVGALFAAIDASARTWEDGGLWRRRPAVSLYAWRSPLRWAFVLALAGLCVLVVPLAVLAVGVIAYPLSFLAQMVNVDAGYRLATGYANLVRWAFSSPALPTVVPRLVTLCLALSAIVLAGAALRSRGSSGVVVGKSQRDPGRWWARLVGAPWSLEGGLRHVRVALWQFFRGPAQLKEPAPADLSRRYAELLVENLGQPGFRELILAGTDLETRADVVFAALHESRRREYFLRARGDLIDIAGAGRSQVLDALSMALSIPVMTEPHVLTFSPESYWKGESHRTCDRAGAVARLFDELAAAGVEQVVVVTADADRSAPHRLSTLGGSLESRVSEHLAAVEVAAVTDAVSSNTPRFRGVFLVRPVHNPIGPLDFRGTYDERSDRYQDVVELIDRGYEDAYRQFIEPVVGGAE